MSTVSEGSITFFERKLRAPYEMIPFFAILIFNPFEKPLEVVLGIAVVVLMGDNLEVLLRQNLGGYQHR